MILTLTPRQMKHSWLLLTGLLASAADLEIRFTALERMASEQMFTEVGKRWVQSNAASKCQFE